MIGSNFEIAEQDITRVEWIQSDGRAYIDLEYIVAPDTENSKHDNMLEVDFLVLNGVDNAPGYVFGTRTSEGNEEMALKIDADHVTIEGHVTAEWENHRATADCANAYSNPISGDLESSDPLITDGGAYIANGCRHKVMLRSFAGHYINEALWFEYIIDRQFRVASSAVLWVPCTSYSPNTVFLFAKNDGLLNPIGVNPSMRVYGLKCITITGGSTLAPEVECTRNLIPAVKVGVGAGLYDIIAGKFYPAKGGTMLYGGIVA